MNAKDGAELVLAKLNIGKTNARRTKPPLRVPATQVESVAVREPAGVNVIAANDEHEFLSRAAPAVQAWADARALAQLPKQGWEP